MFYYSIKAVMAYELHNSNMATWLRAICYHSCV